MDEIKSNKEEVKQRGGRWWEKLLKSYEQERKIKTERGDISYSVLTIKFKHFGLAFFGQHSSNNQIFGIQAIVIADFL